MQTIVSQRQDIIAKWLAMLPDVPNEDEYGRPWQLCRTRGMTPAQQRYFAAVKEQQAPATAGQLQPAREPIAPIAVVTDEHVYFKRGERITRKAHTMTCANHLLQACFDLRLDTIWVLAGTQLSKLATKQWIETASPVWFFNNAQYDEKEPGNFRPTFLLAWRPDIEHSKVHLGFLEYNMDWGLSKQTDPSLALMVLCYLSEALGVPLHFKPHATGKAVMREETSSKEREQWVRPIRLPERIVNNVHPLAWKRSLSGSEIIQDGELITGDKNSQYAAATTSALLGEGDPIYQEKPVFSAKQPGAYLCTVTDNHPLYNGLYLPKPWESLPVIEAKDGKVTLEVWTYTLQLLYELGFEVEIHSGYVWEKSHTTLRTWAERVWRARTRLKDGHPDCDTQAFPNAQARTIASKTMKNVISPSLGLLAMGKQKYATDKLNSWHRPDWYALIIDRARYWTFKKIEQLYNLGYIVIGCHTDCLFFLALTNEGLEDLFKRQHKLGGYKRKFTRPVTIMQAGELFNIEEAQIEDINSFLLAYDRGEQEL